MSSIFQCFKPLIKWILRSSAVSALASALAASYIWFVFKTTRWTIQGEENVLALIRENKPFIVVFWHNRLLMTCYAWKKWHPFHMLISGHKDGQLIAKTVGHYGIRTIVGSKSKGGTQALREMKDALAAGHTVGMTPDGPRGPVFSVSKGVGVTARLAQVPVIPLAYGTSRKAVLNTWDKFVFPWPFGRGNIVWGQPLSPPASKDVEEFCEAVGRQLHGVTAIADGESDAADAGISEQAIP